ncbi:MAG TPA: gamma-glutamylcyclotransferase family protein [Pirellulales bacterium]|nr:gamma-glutamylcyclotransferase family protein [Pirellulales bacterium]
MDHEFLVFVYGSLKRGQSNHDLLAQAEFLSHCQTQPQFALFDLGDYPALVRDAAAPQAIAGELYRASAALLARLDRLEDNGRLYQRELLLVRSVDDDRSWQAWAYLYLGQLENSRRWPLASWPA